MGFSRYFVHKVRYGLIAPGGGGAGGAGMAGIPWGLDSQSRHYPQEFDRRLWHRGGTLDVSARNDVQIWMHVQGILDTKLSHG